MKESKSKDIFTECFDSIFELGVKSILCIADKCFQLVVNQSANKSFNPSHTKDLKTTTKPNTLGYENVSRKDFKFEDYNSDVPLSLVIGPPGVGKTVLLLNLIDRDLSMNRPYIVIDPKASEKSKESFVELSKRYGKEPLIFEPSSDLRINPLKNLTPVQVVECIYRAFPNAHEYYGPRSKDILLDLIRKLKTTRKIISFFNIYREIDDLSRADKQIKLETQGLKSNLKLLLNSPFGQLFHDRGDALTISDIREKSLSLYISLPTLAYSSLSESIAKIFIAELMNHSYQAMNHTNYKDYLSVYIDEAGSFLFEDFKSLPAQCREAGVSLTIATQTISDLKRITGNFLNQILTYTANFWIFRISDPQDAETISRYLGTRKSVKLTVQTEDGVDSGRGSERDTEEFIVHTNILKNLPQYSAILKCSGAKEPAYISIRNFSKVYQFEDNPRTIETNSNRLKKIDIFETAFFD